MDIEAYYRKYGPMVLRRCRYLLNSEEKAVDAMQDTFVSLIRNRHKLKNTYPSSLLFRIATNICINMLRRERMAERKLRDEPVFTDVFSVEDNFENRDLVLKIFSSEKQSTAEIATLLFIDGMTLEEAAREVGLSVSGVRKRIACLKNRIREFTEVLK
ncbi:MAG: sigma-70 family RNA polymerase sigma factor [Oligoflexia bacterium]|nr:sigma-70 family RNA polymerase sigma factor [Oligoflexia bacterium]